MIKTISLYDKKNDVIPILVREIEINKAELEEAEDKEIFIQQEFGRQVFCKMFIEYK